MRSGRILAVVLLGLCVAAAGAVAVLRSGNGEPPKAPLQGSVVEWNMSGFSQNKGSTTPAEVLIQTLAKRSPLPLAVVTTETCSAQFDLLRERLAAAPFAYRAAENWSIPNFGQPNCASFGNAIFWLGDAPPDGVERLTYPAATQAEGAATQEKRNLLCVRFTTHETPAAATPLRICGTHLDNDAAIASRQFAVARDRVDRYNRAGPPTLLMGDLNMIPGSAAFDPWYRTGRYIEADGPDRSTARPTTNGKFPFKFDYGFLPSATVARAQPAAIQQEPASSDHGIYTTFFALTSTQTAATERRNTVEP
jgi:endonuclease/exonuclease/phosphatase family metal-dependent hydrolase